MTLTVGIPSRGINPSLYRVIDHALSLDADEIIVAINPGGEKIDDLSKYSDPRLRIFFHEDDLGLYGNFRFLVKRASSEYFSWLCTDDLISADIPSLLRGLHGSGDNLIIPTWLWAEYNSQGNNMFDLTNMKEGTLPDLSSSRSIVQSALHSEPSWIFGIWRTRYLRSIFPSRNFDWLDTHLLQKALLSNKVSVISTANPTIIGTWHWAAKVPSSVSQKGHSPWMAIFHQLTLVPRLILRSPTSFWSIVLRLRFLILCARSMNNNKTKGIAAK
jgi:glycosyltransferase involved in cell wall biosynthesis